MRFYTTNGVEFPQDLIELKIERETTVLEICLPFYKGRNFCRENNVEYYVSCGWVCVTHYNFVVRL